MYEEKEIKFKKRSRIDIPKEKKTKNYNFITKINWKQLGIKLFVLIIVMVLIIFIISRISNNNQKNDSVLNNNLNKIVESTLNFYTIKTLPHNIGDSNSMLLEEMIQKNLLEKIYDYQKKECNATNSYIIITKTSEEEYRLKVYLSCPKEEKSIEKILNCNITCQIKKEFYSQCY